MKKIALFTLLPFALALPPALAAPNETTPPAAPQNADAKSQPAKPAPPAPAPKIISVYPDNEEDEDTDDDNRRRRGQSNRHGGVNGH